MAKQYQIDQIKQLKERDEFNLGHSALGGLREIDNLLDKLDESKITNRDPILKYIPLATVACIEGVFRSAVKELIDSGKPFTDNALELEKKSNIKITFEALFEIQNRNFTSGELIAHALPCSKLEDINNALSAILKTDFLDILKKFERPTIFQRVANEFKHFQKNHPSIYEDVKRLFALRHILAHETTRKFVIDKTEILRCYACGQMFIKQMEAYIQHITNADIIENIEATKEKYRQMASEIEKQVEKLFARKDPKPNLFEQFFQEEKEEAHKNAVDAWRNYRHKKSILESKRSFGANWIELGYYKSYIQITQDMIDHLNKNGTFY